MTIINSHKLSPVMPIPHKALPFGGIYLTDTHPRDLIMGLTSAQLLEGLFNFLDNSVTIAEKLFLMTTFGGAATLQTDDLIKLCAKQDAGYEGDVFIKEELSGRKLVSDGATGAIKERFVIYGATFLRLVDDHRGHQFKLRGVFEMTDFRTTKCGEQTKHNVFMKEFRYTKGGKWGMFHGITPQVKRYMESFEIGDIRGHS